MNKQSIKEYKERQAALKSESSESKVEQFEDNAIKIDESKNFRIRILLKDVFFMNDYIQAAKSRSHYVPAAKKRNSDNAIRLQVLAAQSRSTMTSNSDVENFPKVLIEPHDYVFQFHLSNKRKDNDNVSGGFHKSFFDGLQKANLIHGDGVKFVHDFTDTFQYDTEKDQDYVDVIVLPESSIKNALTHLLADS